MPSHNNCYEIRGVIEWFDSDGRHREVLVRDDQLHAYKRLPVGLEGEIIHEVKKALGVKKEQISLPEHVKRGLE